MTDENDDDLDDIEDLPTTQAGDEQASVQRPRKGPGRSPATPSCPSGGTEVAKKRRRRDNWSPEEDEIFFRLYRENEGMLEQELLRKITEELAPRRTYQQVKGHLKNMRAASKM
jgi:hypothetical protein